MKNTKISAVDAFTLVSAEPEQAEYAPVLRVLLAVAYTGILSAVVAAMASVLMLVSGKDAVEKLSLSAAALIGFSLLAFFLSLFDKKKRREFEESERLQLENAERFKANVVSAEKRVKTIVYANNKYDETTWAFVIEYADEDGKTVTVKSGSYYNDLSDILADTAVEVIKKPDGSYSFGEFKLRSEDGEGIKLPVNEIGEGI